jgi:diphthamide synthase (EF-2-diphthine--ammonia ligase)
MLADLPVGIDRCGENGELHSFVAAGPMLRRRVPMLVGETVERDGVAYADLTVPGRTATPDGVSGMLGHNAASLDLRVD